MTAVGDAPPPVPPPLPPVPPPMPPVLAPPVPPVLTPPVPPVLAPPVLTLPEPPELSPPAPPVLTPPVPPVPVPPVLAPPSPTAPPDALPPSLVLAPLPDTPPVPPSSSSNGMSSYPQRHAQQSHAALSQPSAPSRRLRIVKARTLQPSSYTGTRTNEPLVVCSCTIVRATTRPHRMQCRDGSQNMRSHASFIELTAAGVLHSSRESHRLGPDVFGAGRARSDPVGRWPFAPSWLPIEPERRSRRLEQRLGAHGSQREHPAPRFGPCGPPRRASVPSDAARARRACLRRHPRE